MGLGVIAGFVISVHNTQSALAQTECTVDQGILTKLYAAIFHRPLDAGASSHLGQPLDTVLNDISSSTEQTEYSGVYEAVKALEEAQRAPGGVSDADLQKYKSIIDSALSTVSTWAGTLPQQALANRVVGPDHARAAVQHAYDSLNTTAQSKAQYGLFNASTWIGNPATLPVPSSTQPQGYTPTPPAFSLPIGTPGTYQPGYTPTPPPLPLPSTPTTTTDFSQYQRTSLNKFTSDPSAYLSQHIFISNIVSQCLPSGGAGGTTNYVKVTDPVSGVSAMAQFDSSIGYYLVANTVTIGSVMKVYGAGSLSVPFTQNGQTILIPVLKAQRVDYCPDGGGGSNSGTDPNDPWIYGCYGAWQQLLP